MLDTCCNMMTMVSENIQDIEEDDAVLEGFVNN